MDFKYLAFLQIAPSDQIKNRGSTTLGEHHEHPEENRLELLTHHFHNMLTAENEVEPDKRLGDLSLLQGVRKFPLRVKCATLAWHAVEQALDKQQPKGAHLSIEDDPV